jgi:predicted AAA+ superfamily ATPase
MALWHLSNHIADPSIGTELLPAAGRPKSVMPIAVDSAKAGVPQFAAHGPIKVHSLWGEVFFRLGGEKALRSLGKADDLEASPSDAQIEAAFPKGPVLILLDELVIYMAKLSDRGQGNLLGFLNSLNGVVSKRPQTVLVVADTAGQAAYASEAAKLADITAAATSLHEVLSKKMTDFDPVGNEAARVIVRRLFEDVNAATAQAASATYHGLFRRVAQDSPGSLPATASGANYAARIVECYPFRPRLLDTAQDRLGALQDF